MFRLLFISLFGLTAFAQQTSKVDFIKCDALVLPNAFEKSISGSVIYEFKVKKAIDTIKIDAINMQFSELIINGKLVNFKNSGKTLDLFEGFKKGKNKVKTQDSLTNFLLIIGMVILIVMGVFPGILSSFLQTPMW